MILATLDELTADVSEEARLFWDSLELERWYPAITTTIYILLILLGGVVVSRLIGRGLRKVEENKRVSPVITRILAKLMRGVILICVLLLVFQQLGVRISSLWTMLTAMAAMVAVGFVAVWSVLSNVLCTLMLIFFKPFRVGDEIEVIEPSSASPGLKGKVVNLNMVFTSIEEIREDDERYTLQIPNNIFFQKAVRRKKGRSTVSLDRQLFEDGSLLKKPSAEA